MGKVFWVGIITAGVIFSCILITSAMPVIRSFTQIAYDDPSAGNYSGYKEAVGASNIWLYGIPFVVGFIGVIMILREKRKLG